MPQCHVCKNNMNLPPALLQRYQDGTDGKNTRYKCQQCRTKVVELAPPLPNNNNEVDVLEKLDFQENKANFVVNDFKMIHGQPPTALNLERRVRFIKMMALMSGMAKCITDFLNGGRMTVSMDFVKRLHWELEKRVKGGPTLDLFAINSYPQNPRAMCSYMQEAYQLFTKMIQMTLNNKPVMEDFVNLLTFHDKGYHRLLEDLRVLNQVPGLNLEDKLAAFREYKKLTATD
jgi:hypothetical protein